eukprot:TRINITY_DN819_c0_g1_i3.p1 TRINITY_DN819_c0_g1~~TRINITY_DN819_c0_g1_i3.p1  ORF type:complete len:853 (-),score=148.91 TRINITY_DN819_c0_g1_i3:113-2671(-)
MRPPYIGLWQRVPGYDSEEEDEEEEQEEVATAAAARERLQDVLAALGDRLTDVEVMRFHPPHLPKTSAENGNSRPPPPRRDNWSPGHWSHPMYFRMERSDASIVKETLRSNGLIQTQDHSWIVQWSGPGMLDWMYQGLHEFQRVNHFPMSTELTRKDRLWSHFEEMARTFGTRAFDFVPESFVLPAQVDKFMERYQGAVDNDEDALWIVKPSVGSQGRGIFILRDLEDLPLDESSVVSRYLDNPLLIQGLKFDLRVYVVVTGFEPLRAYVYREGLTRFASKAYSTEDEHLDDVYRHLTNYSINKKASNFVENSKVHQDNVGHKWSLSALNRHLECVGVDVELMWVRIMDLISKTLLSVAPTIAAKTKQVAPYPENCFEVYGFDVLVDEDLKPWLIEVNLSPSMQAESPLDWHVKSALLSDVFNLIGLPRVDRDTVAKSRAAARARSAAMQQRGMPQQTMRRSASHGGLQSGSKKDEKDSFLARPRTAKARPAQDMDKNQEPWEDRPLTERRVDRSFSCSRTSTEFASERERASDLPGQRDPVTLEHMSEDRLRGIARGLQETGRINNFITLYPTRQTVKRYQPITEANGSWIRDSEEGGSRCSSRSSRRNPLNNRSSNAGGGILPIRAKAITEEPSLTEIYASLLLGPPPVRPKKREEDDSDEETGSDEAEHQSDEEESPAPPVTWFPRPLRHSTPTQTQAKPTIATQPRPPTPTQLRPSTPTQPRAPTPSSVLRGVIDAPPMTRAPSIGKLLQATDKAIVRPSSRYGRGELLLGGRRPVQDALLMEEPPVPVAESEVLPGSEKFKKRLPRSSRRSSTQRLRELSRHRVVGALRSERYHGNLMNSLRQAGAF